MREPIFDSSNHTALVDVRLDSEDPPREELAIDDFSLCAEVGRLMSLLDQVENGRISKIEVRAGIPRRITLEKRVKEFACCEAAGSKDPVRRLMVETEKKTAVKKTAGHRRDAWRWRCSEAVSASSTIDSMMFLLAR
jgi:hypothetical protein